MLRALGGNSPFLSDLAVREAATCAGCGATARTRSPQPRCGRWRACPAGADRASLAATLRRAKRRVALAAAVADIGGIWPLERVTAALSALAEAALDAGVAYGLRAAHAAARCACRRGRRLLADAA